MKIKLKVAKKEEQEFILKGEFIRLILEQEITEEEISTNTEYANKLLEIAAEEKAEIKKECLEDSVRFKNEELGRNMVKLSQKIYDIETRKSELNKDF